MGTLVEPVPKDMLFALPSKGARAEATSFFTLYDTNSFSWVPLFRTKWRVTHLKLL